MPVAPSFESYRKVIETPFIKNGKLYVVVEHPKTKRERTVRWYSDAEFSKAYGSKIVDVDRGYDGLKHARGFDKGPILVIRHNKPQDEAWLRESIARYAVGIGWYIASTDKFPEDAPANFKYLLLGWDEFKDGDDRHMKKPTELTKILSDKARKNQWVFERK